MMFYTKNESSGICRVGQEGFFKLRLEYLFIDPKITPSLTYVINQIRLNKFGRGPPKSFEVYLIKFIVFVTLGAWSILPHGYYLNNFGIEPLDGVLY